MATETWPAEPLLPAIPDKTGFSNTPVTNTVSSREEYNLNTLRRRSLVSVKDINMQMILTSAQVSNLEDFYVNDLNIVDSFNWIDHITGLAAVYRFKKAPSISYDSPDNWIVKLNLEMVPF